MEGDRFAVLAQEAEALCETCRDRGIEAVVVPPERGGPAGPTYTVAFPEAVLCEWYQANP